MAQIKFIKGSIKFSKRHATVKIPLSLAKQLYKGNDNEESFATVINGILQISTKVPDVVIPMIDLKEQYFVPQKH